MIAYLRILACAAALFAAGAASAQDARPCPNGEADGEGISINSALAAHPTRVAAAVDSVLQAQGYTILGAPAGVGRWRVAPIYSWTREALNEEWTEREHPGVHLGVQTEVRGDSTRLVVGARALCATAGGEEAETLAEMTSALMVVSGVTEHLDTLKAAGVDPSTPVQRRGGSVQIPEEVAGFRFQGRRDFEDRRLGTSVRYARADGMHADVYVYPGVRVDSACDAACAVDQEADGFVGSFPELVRAGHYQNLEVTADERLQPPASAPWAYGRHVTMKVRREGRVLESHYHLFSFPGFMVKVRATFPAAAGARRDLDAFVEDLLARLLPDV